MTMMAMMKKLRESRAEDEEGGKEGINPSIHQSTDDDIEESLMEKNQSHVRYLVFGIDVNEEKKSEHSFLSVRDRHGATS